MSEAPADQVDALPPSSVSLTGYLGSRLRGNARYLHRIHDEQAEQLLAPFGRRGDYRRDRDWDGEYAGKWLDAAVLTAAALGDAPLRAKADALAAELRRTQAADGYLGIEPAGKRGRTAWDVWNHWYAVTGLLTHYEQTGEEASLEAARRAARWILRQYGPIEGADARFFRAAWQGGCNVDVVGQLARLAGYVEQPLRGELSTFCVAALEHYGPVKEMRATGRAHLTHAYVLAAYLNGAVSLARLEARPQRADWVAQVWSDLQTAHLYPTGGLGFGERIRSEAPHDKPDGHHQETCATVEWMLLSENLYRLAGEARYAHALEHTAYNALLAAQSRDGMQWTYFTPLRYRKHWMQGPTRCCFFSGPRGVARLPRLVYRRDGEGIRVELFEAGRARTTIDGSDVEISQTTQFPAQGSISITVDCRPAARFCLKVRVPRWAENARVEVDGQPAVGHVESGGYVPIWRTWSRGRVDVQLPLPIRAVPMGETGACFARGPEVLSAEVAENPGIELDGIRLPPPGTTVLCEPVGISPATPESLRRYRATWNQGQATQHLVLVPYAQAGQGARRFRTVFSGPGVPADD